MHTSNRVHLITIGDYYVTYLSQVGLAHLLIDFFCLSYQDHLSFVDPTLGSHSGTTR